MLYIYGLFLHKYINKDKKLNIIHLSLYTLPCIIYLLFVLGCNPLEKLIFSINEYNSYTRGPYFIYSVLFSIFYIVYSLIYILLNRKKLNMKEIWILSSVNLFPIIGAFLQTISFGILVMYPLTAMSIVMLYIFLQNKLVLFDTLTNAWTRASFDSYMDNIAKENNTDYALAFLDIDDFKNINNTYGHTEGDHVLKKFSYLISESLPEGCFVARYGGDEFVIYFNTKDTEKINTILDKIDKNIINFSESTYHDYKISYSCEYEVFNTDLFFNNSQLIREIDNRMHKKKLRAKMNV